MLDNNLKSQLQNIFAELQGEYVLSLEISQNHQSKSEITELLQDFQETSPKITFVVNDGNDLTLSILKNGSPLGIKFRAVPNGHEFSSLIMAILNADGKGKNLPDEAIISKIKAFSEKIEITSYISLTCTNCPDVVQSLNIFALLNPNITHTIVDGAINQSEVEKLNIQAVPTVFANGEILHIGAANLGGLLSDLEKRFKTNDTETSEREYFFDVVIVGGGPAGSSAAVYSARKGLKTAIIADRIGGQVKETLGIENLISVPYTTGDTLADNLKTHLQKYNVSLFENRRVILSVLEKNQNINVKIISDKNEIFYAKAMIIATGAKWKKLNIAGESEHIGKGVAFCPHCDGPLFAGKNVTVVGGGNSGIEAAIDLSAICKSVTVVEFLDELKADSVLQEKAKNIKNINIFTSTQTTEIIGDTQKVTAIIVKNRKNDEVRKLKTDGVFVQIGLMPNSDVFKDLVNTNKFGEIIIDEHCRTSSPHIYAAGDVSTVPYKQIIISMGEGAKAALTMSEEL